MRALLLLLCLLVTACASQAPRGAMTGSRGEAISEPISCVPYARARSGIQISGDAWQWWGAASSFGYGRGRAPQPGAVLVISRTSRMRDGHVSYVTRVISEREIRVDHANWASGSAKGRVAQDQRVVDVSPGNDWSLVRVFYPPINDLGTSTYPALGFVYPAARGGVMASR